MIHPDDKPDEGVGSVGDEAAKLFGALADMARQQGGDLGHGLNGLAGQAAALAKDLDEHIATDAAECRYCPVCRAIHVVRETSPEVRAHLMAAASSLLKAASGILESVPPPERDHPARRGPEVEHIDLDDDSDGPDSDGPDSDGPEGGGQP